MKQLPRATAEKTKPICKNEKTNLNLCLKITYEKNYFFRLCKNEPNFRAWPPAEPSPPANSNRTRSAPKKANYLHFRLAEMIIAADLQGIETGKFVNQYEYGYGV
jgi:hypothetical protein